MAEKKKMSVAEILAAARAKDGGGAAAPSASEPQASSERQAASELEESSQVEAEAKPKAKPAAKPAAATAAGGARLSVADILAAARAKKAEGGEGAAVEAAAAAKPKPAAADKPKPAAAAKPKPAAAASAPKTGVQRDTGSILAAARGGAKPGPVSKAEAPDVTAKLQAAAAKPKAAPVEKGAVARAAPPMPARPAKPAAKKDGEEDRRGFLEIAMGSFMAMGFTALSVTGGLFTLGLARFMFPNVLAEPPSRFKVGFKEGFRNAQPVLLEPVMKVEVVTPEDYYGDVIGDLNRRRGQIHGMAGRRRRLDPKPGRR